MRAQLLELFEALGRAGRLALAREPFVGRLEDLHLDAIRDLPLGLALRLEPDVLERGGEPVAREVVLGLDFDDAAPEGDGILPDAALPPRGRAQAQGRGDKSGDDGAPRFAVP